VDEAFMAAIIPIHAVTDNCAPRALPGNGGGALPQCTTTENDLEAARAPG